ncbi:MAG: hypothetical protein EOO71_06210 [Myxococcaceae bacterium]|nr:MAG: hypothetical protein EOO71_06210 [Myxococcaceae bacterium]
MDANTQSHFVNLRSKDADSRSESYRHLMAVTDAPVDWAAEVWAELLALLREGDNHQRAIAAQLLSNLAKSDPARLLKDLDQVLVVTKDEKFVTARHSLQTLWRAAVVDKALRAAVVDRLSQRFRECSEEKNGTLVRYDILEVFRKTYDVVKDDALKQLALTLIEEEEDPKYRKKYAGLWKDLVAKKRAAKD